MATFKAGSVKAKSNKWISITSDSEVLQTVNGLKISLVCDPPSHRIFQHPFGIKEKMFIETEIEILLKKGVIARPKHEQGEFISPIFVRPKSDGGFRLI